MEKFLAGRSTRPPCRIVFAGTPKFAVPTLRALCESPLAHVLAVYTQPDRAAGRGRSERMSAVKQFALHTARLIEQPISWRDPVVQEKFRSYSPDLLVVAAYGLVLPAETLNIPPLGALNVHASVLPRWRGAAPIQRAIMAGDTETGITIMQVVPELDAGPIVLMNKTPITNDDTAGSLEARLAEIGAKLMLEALERLLSGRGGADPQNSDGVTYAPKLNGADRVLNWTLPAANLARCVRALNPVPLAITEVLGMRVHVSEATAIDNQLKKRPGTVLALSPVGIDIAAGSDALRLLKIQPEGKRPMSARDFLNGYRHKLTRE